MSPLPPDQSSPPKQVVLVKSPRDAATWAIIYRRTLRDRPRDRWLKVVAVIGALLVHVAFLLGMVLGPAYVLPPEPPQPKGNALLVKLIEKKPEQPPPPPPIRGIPPKEHGPTHRGNTNQIAHVTHEALTAMPVAAVVQPPAPAPKQPPVIAQAKEAIAQKAPAPAAPMPPVSLPKPTPPALQQPKPVGTPPPPPTVQATPVPQPVPPPLQPEPARKPQAEGKQAMPPLPSLAIPNQPEQSPLTATPLQIATDQPAIAPVTVANVVPATPAPEPATPVEPAQTPAPAPLPAVPAPTVNLQQSVTAQATPLTPQISPQTLAPVVKANAPEPALPQIALTSMTTPAPTQPPAAQALDITAPKIAVPAITVTPQLSVAAAPTPTPSPSESKTPEASSSNEKAANEAPSTSPNTAASPSQSDENNASASTAPNATPQGSETANPGALNGGTRPSQTNGPPNEQSIPTGNGNMAGPINGGTPGTPAGDFIQLKPRGDTDIMSHNVNLPKYNPTRFDKYWTPKGESSVDTALRHAVEKTTVSHTFNLPQGIRIECSVVPLLPSALLGCHNPDPPAAPLSKKTYDRLNLPTMNASIPKATAPATSTSTPAAAVSLNNDAECAAARVSGGPLPSNCATTEVVAKPLHLPAPATTSWVSASDQFH